MTKSEGAPARSRSVEDYLKTIYKIESDGVPATTGSLANRLALTPASVTGMLQRLAGLDPPLVDYEKRRGATLTEAGRRRALLTLRHHRLVETFLYDVLGYGWDEVHDEAETLEHVISEALEDRIAERLGHPVTDPHGDPIPAKDGTIPEILDAPLGSVAVGGPITVTRVSDADAAMLRYLAEIGLTPGAGVVVIGRGPFDGPITIRVVGGGEHALGRRLASKVYVRTREGGSAE